MITRSPDNNVDNGSQRAFDHGANRVARRETVDGITRVHWVGGGHTDVCVTNEQNGPMDFQRHLRH